jgi:hypothetical protein
VHQVGSLWSDDASRSEYVAQLRWRLFADFAMPDSVQHTIYFPLDLCPLTDHELFPGRNQHKWRPHCLEGWDLVLYAIPDDRLAQSVTRSRT